MVMVVMVDVVVGSYCLPYPSVGGGGALTTLKRTGGRSLICFSLTACRGKQATREGERRAV